jgi:hypothetical protein
MCTSAYSFTRDQDDFRIVKNVDPPYFHKANDLSNKPLLRIHDISFILSSIGIFGYIFKIDYNKNLVMIFAFIVNMLISASFL